MAEATNSEKEKSGGNLKIVLIIIIAFLLITNGFTAFNYITKEKENKEQVIVIKEKEEANQGLIAKLDSIGKEYQTLLEANQKLGLDVTDLNSKIEALNKDKEALRRQANAVGAIKAKYESKIKSYENDLSDLRTKLENAEKEREALFAENTEIKQQKEQLKDSINLISAKKEELAQKVAVASILKADNFKVTVLTKKGKEKNDSEMSYKAKNIDKIKVNFAVFENKVAKVETKTFYLRVVGPDGAALYDESTGGGSITVEGNQVYYTAKQDILYDGKKQPVTFLYHKGNEWKKGGHKVEVLCEENKIGEGSFTVR